MPFHLTVLLAAAMSYAVLRMVVQAWRSLLAAPRVDTLSAAPVGDAGARRDDAPARRSGDLSAPDLSRVARVEAGPMGHAAGVALLWGGGDPHVRIESAAASTADAWLRPVASDATDSDFDAEVSSDAAPVQSTDIDNRYRSINSRRSRLPLQWISRHRVRRFGQLFAVLLALPLLSGCATLNHGMLAAGGPVMDQERRLFLIVGFVMLFVIGPVLLLTPIFAWHYRLSNTKSAYRPEWGFSWSLEFLIWIPPTIIVIILGFFLWNYTHALDPYKPLASDKPALRVQAVSLDWKWLFIYPDEGVATINDLVFPADRPVHLYLTSGTVMQSLLLPQLAGQIYAMAGMTTELNFAANAPGEFRGENVQYSGDGFPHEKFPIHALSSGDYGKWLADTRADKRSLDLAGYKHLVTVREPAEPQVFGSVASNLFQSAVNQNMPGVRSADMDKKNTMDGMSMKDMK